MLFFLRHNSLPYFIVFLTLHRSVCVCVCVCLLCRLRRPPRLQHPSIHNPPLWNPQRSPRPIRRHRYHPTAKYTVLLFSALCSLVHWETLSLCTGVWIYINKQTMTCLMVYSSTDGRDSESIPKAESPLTWQLASCWAIGQSKWLSRRLFLSVTGRSRWGRHSRREIQAARRNNVCISLVGSAPGYSPCWCCPWRELDLFQK